MKSLSLSHPHLLIMVGVAGSGKSTFAEKFSDTFHAPHISFDTIMDLCAGNQQSADSHMTYVLRELVKTGHTIILDGLAATRSQRTELIRLATASSYKPVFIWVQTDAATAKARFLKTQKARGKAYTPEEYDELASNFMPLGASEKPVVISGKHTFATQAKIVLKHLAVPRSQSSQPITPPSPRVHTTTNRTIIVR